MPSPTGPVRHEVFDHDVRARLVSSSVELTLKSTSPGGVDLWKEGAGLYQRECARFACLVTNCRHKGENGGSGLGGAEPAYKHLMARPSLPRSRRWPRPCRWRHMQLASPEASQATLGSTTQSKSLMRVW